MTPTRMEFQLGRDHHGRAVTATATINAQRQTLWTIERAPATQRDDLARIMDLPHEALKCLALAVISVEKAAL